VPADLMSKASPPARSRPAGAPVHACACRTPPLRSPPGAPQTPSSSTGSSGPQTKESSSLTCVRASTTRRPREIAGRSAVDLRRAGPGARSPTHLAAGYRPHPGRNRPRSRPPSCRRDRRAARVAALASSSIKAAPCWRRAGTSRCSRKRSREACGLPAGSRAARGCPRSRHGAERKPDTGARGKNNKNCPRRAGRPRGCPPGGSSSAVVRCGARGVWHPLTSQRSGVARSMPHSHRYAWSCSLDGVSRFILCSFAPWRPMRLFGLVRDRRARSGHRSDPDQVATGRLW
jgi:hypothetical protein